MRYAAAVEYDGTRYSGWQRQPSFAHTIQEHIEHALSQVANQAIITTCSGRTDAGVHALAQVIHFDTDAARSDFSWLAGTNRYLPDDIRLRWLIPVDESFHARYSAIKRYYRYLICRRSQPSALWRARCHWHRYPLAPEDMHAAAQALIGEHDFSAFRAAECQAKTPMRFIESITVGGDDDWLWVDVCGNAFLHHMVRNIVGTLLAVGDGRQPCEWVKEVLESRDRKQAGITAPAAGLYFVKAHYDQHFVLPTTAIPEGGLW
ncbi:tRNA pseudouridine(38-40) synthase TruA [Suttonella sp. R2A3]|uniref:tRNA pseudouridine(38-40) synthase TruA n=1 Tax=Suttonella sp. R2A3 TaxID=2908648 RepID=UPI001F32F7E4|nr:tRNA pseudouridine(38-40) synthase TruA [Suttonella sp. R2A3]UJF24791.1 tRNA pseudouridine(38-40) synthase TruA [Suttonella sp. R2A3]